MNPIPHASTSTRLLNPHIFPPESLGGSVVPTGLTSQVPKGNIKRGKVPNKTEREFGLMLEARKRAGEFDKITFEGVTLRLAERLRYTPDWFCERWENINRPVFFEVKGAWIDGDSIPKFKMAREQHKWADFELWQKKAGQWTRLM